MNRLAQAGIFIIVLGCVTLFMGFFPFAIDLNATPGIGIAQILVMLTGLFLVVVGCYTIVYGMFHQGRPRTLLRDIGTRLGMTGLVVAAAAMLADIMGVGSHLGATALFGWLQGVGMLSGFLVAMLGVLIYGLARS